MSRGHAWGVFVSEHFPSATPLHFPCLSSPCLHRVAYVYPGCYHRVKEPSQSCDHSQLQLFVWSISWLRLFVIELAAYLLVKKMSKWRCSGQQNFSGSGQWFLGHITAFVLLKFRSIRLFPFAGKSEKYIFSKYCALNVLHQQLFFYLSFRILHTWLARSNNMHIVATDVWKAPSGVIPSLLFCLSEHLLKSNGDLIKQALEPYNIHLTYRHEPVINVIKVDFRNNQRSTLSKTTSDSSCEAYLTKAKTGMKVFKKYGMFISIQTQQNLNTSNPVWHHMDYGWSP